MMFAKQTTKLNIVITMHFGTNSGHVHVNDCVAKRRLSWVSYFLHNIFTYLYVCTCGNCVRMFVYQYFI